MYIYEIILERYIHIKSIIELRWQLENSTILLEFIILRKIQSHSFSM